MKKRIFCISLVFLLSHTFGKAQSTLGPRFGNPLSISYKQFLSESDNAIEVYVGFRSRANYQWTNISGAFQKHKPLDEVIEGLRYYYGGGASVFIWSFDSDFLGTYSSTAFGIQAYLGLDYEFESVPINVSVDWIPTYLFNGYGSGFGGRYGSLAIRYVFRK